jgi:hypothetical protein
MAKQKLKIDQLAKLRQFKPGMDPSAFLSTEFRQIVRALEQAYIETDGEPPFTIDQGTTVLWAHQEAALSDGLVSLSTISAIPNESGQITTNVFFPAEEGRYFIRFGYKHASTVSTATPVPFTKIECFTSDLTLLCDAFFAAVVVAPSTASSAHAYPENCVFADLSPTVGVFFDVSRNGAGSPIITKFHCEITKIS